MFKEAMREAFTAIALMGGLFAISLICERLLFGPVDRRKKRRGRK